ncbi:hypothetical protein PPL_09504 [Heterostelium album PN500]|uniref:Uncharacterized protein n=1 Tax=Heterostelium pallidum (strain ATCC 26659 / Pp 5 / PN500) TaxID=670386 RepID=D3BN93_HETP5|nr:hypothetical protein PPL_09504 [Heterostelium album PN500]EFA76753.1 hypothetical protein PPL_09504 [Heterostelium album PN500]|eukprot:XP_020428885.1 hypothetical protein PPL_09504 [Heterostelium album PN500]
MNHFNNNKNNSNNNSNGNGNSPPPLTTNGIDSINSQLQSLNFTTTLNQSFDLTSSTGSLSDSFGSSSGGSGGSGGLSTSTGSNSGNSNNNNNNNNNNNSNNNNSNVANFTSLRTSKESTNPLSNSNNNNDENYSMAKIYLNNKPNLSNQQSLGRVDFNMKSEDLDQCWFHKEATRDVSIALLDSKPSTKFTTRQLCNVLGQGSRRDRTQSDIRFVSGILVEAEPYESDRSILVVASVGRGMRLPQPAHHSVVGDCIDCQVVECQNQQRKLMWSLHIIENPNENVNRSEKRTCVNIVLVDYEIEQTKQKQTKADMMKMKQQQQQKQQKKSPIF